MIRTALREGLILVLLAYLGLAGLALAAVGFEVVVGL